MSATYLVGVLVMAIGAPKAGEDRKPTYEQLQKWVAQMEEKELIIYRPAQIVVLPGEKSDKVKLYRTRIDFCPIQGRTAIDDELIFTIVECIIELNDHEAEFGANKTLAKGIADRQGVVKKMAALIETKESEEDKLKKLDDLREKYGSIETNAFKQYCKERNYEIETRGVEQNVVTVTLTTNPDGGRICMLSAFEYELCKLRGKDADTQLAKSVVAKTDGIALAGKYYYLVEWANGKKSKVGVTTIREAGKYTLP